jgi:hypothetical protein
MAANAYVSHQLLLREMKAVGQVGGITSRKEQMLLSPLPPPVKEEEEDITRHELAANLRLWRVRVQVHTTTSLYKSILTHEISLAARK